LIKLIEVKGKYVLMLAVFLSALTPLPDDLLFIVLGFLRYDLLRVLLPCMLGKATMLYLVRYIWFLFGKLAWEVAEDMGLSEGVLTVVTLEVLTL